MRSGTRVGMLGLMLTAASAAGATEIHRCLMEDGTFAFQETPCSESAVPVDSSSDAGERDSESGAPATEDDAFDFVNPFDEPDVPEPVSEDRAECEKTTRDAIDTIDLEMQGKAYTKEQGEEYLAELLALTRQLRACKQL